MARAHVARQMVKLGGQPELRANFTTDNGTLSWTCADYPS